MSAPNASPASLPESHQVQNITDECTELLRSLPVEKGWIATNYHLYQGFWYASRFIPGVVGAQRRFRALDSDILLATTPKAGTTWLKAILFSLLNRSRYSEPNTRSNHPLLSKNPHELVPYLELDLYLRSIDPDFSSFTSPRLFTTHMPLVTLPDSVKESNCKVVYLCRNPKDTFVSLWHFANKLGAKENRTNPLEETFDKFCRGVSLFGPYWEHVLDYYKANLEMPNKVLFLKFEELKVNPREQLRRLADFLGSPFSETEEANGEVDEILRLCSFNNLSKLEVNQSGKLSRGQDNQSFFRKGEVGDWVNYLSPEMIERIDRITEEKLHGSGLKL